MQVSFATGGTPDAVKAKVGEVLAEQAGGHPDTAALALAIETYVATLVAGVPAGQTAAVSVHVAIGVTSPAQEAAAA